MDESRIGKLGLGALLLAATTIACGGGEAEGPAPEATATESGDAPLSVYVVNYPLMYFAERIGGESVRVVFPAPPEGDPALWQPDADTIAAYQAADLIVRNGATYAKWMDLVTLPESKVVDTSASFGDRLITIEGAVTHSHGPEGEHDHGETAFTTWLDLELALQQAEAIRTALAAARPDAATGLDANMDALRADLLALDARLAAVGAELGDVPLLASHPVYQYLGRRYGLDLESVHFEPGEFPDEAAWRDLEQLHAEHAANWMIWEGEPLAETAERLRGMGVESVVFDPVGNRPESGDFLSIMQVNVSNLEGIVGG